jgi:hypothetical protein
VWGCTEADHIGWVVVQAASERDALAQIPAALRVNAKAKLVAPSFTAEHAWQERHQLNQAKALQHVVEGSAVQFGEG